MLFTRTYRIAGYFRTKNFRTSASKSISVALFLKSVYFEVYVKYTTRDNIRARSALPYTISDTTVFDRDVPCRRLN